MNKKFSSLLYIVISLLIIAFFEPTIYKILKLINIEVSSLSTIIQLIISISIKVIMAIIIFILNKKDLKRLKRNNNVFHMILYLVVGLVGMTLITYFSNYLFKQLSDIFGTKYITYDFYNIFNKKIDIYLILRIINDYILYPYLYVSVVLLVADKITRRTDTFILFSGILAGVIYALSLNGTIIFLIINSLTIFIIFLLIAFLYKKVGSIWFSILLYSFYLITYLFILEYLGL